MVINILIIIGQKIRDGHTIFIDKLAGFAMITNRLMSMIEKLIFKWQSFSYYISTVVWVWGNKHFYKVLELHKGKWHLKRHPANISSVHFWDKVINEYTNGNFELVNSYPRTEYDDGTLADVFFFNN